MRAPVAGSALCLLAAYVLTGCAHVQPSSPTGGIEHAVFVWLKNPGSTKDRNTLVDTSRGLAATIPQIRSFRWGTAVPSERPVVDDTYDVALVMNFTDRAALEKYETNPAHARAAKSVLHPLARKIVVYDIEQNSVTPGKAVGLE